jgi:hypothetical protein
MLTQQEILEYKLYWSYQLMCSIKNVPDDDHGLDQNTNMLIVNLI